MLPPPPPAPMARPVAIIRSTGELAVTTANSPSTSSPTDPAELGPNQEQMTTAAAVGLVGSACQNSVEPVGRKSPTRILVTPHTSNREYTFAHFHSQPGQVSFFYKSFLIFLRILFSSYNIFLHFLK